MENILKAFHRVTINAVSQKKNPLLNLKTIQKGWKGFQISDECNYLKMCTYHLSCK